MRKAFLCLLILISAKAFSQTDSSYRTKKIFYISYLNFDDKIEELEDIKLSGIDSISLTVEHVVLGQNSNMNKSVRKRIVLDRIDKFGYNAGPSFGARVGYGAGIGFVVGAIIGAFGTGTVTGDGHVSPGTYSLPVGLLLAIPGALIGAATGIGAKESEVLDISKYARAKKFEIIKRLIKSGVKKNE